MIKQLRGHARAAILGIGVIFAVAGALWLHGGVAGLVFVLALESIPLLALAAVSPDMPPWLSLSAAAGIGAFTVDGVKALQDSTSSTAAIVIPFIPLILLAAVPILLAVCDVVVLVRFRAGGGTIAPPRRGEIALAVVLAAAGFLAFFVYGMVAGAAVALAIWAHRIRVQVPA
jgi:hypothetical protein